TKVRLAALATGNGARFIFSAGGNENPSRVRFAIELKRHDSSVRFGSGSEANFSYAARLRSSHQLGAAVCVARCEAKTSGVKEPMGERVAVTGAGEGADIV